MTGAASGGLKLQCIAIATFSSYYWKETGTIPGIQVAIRDERNICLFMTK